MTESEGSRESFAHHIAQFGQTIVRSKQVLSRLTQLLPKRFQRLVAQYRDVSRSGTKAQRLALLDPVYLSYLHEINELNFNILKVKVAWETGLMLYRLRASAKTRSFRVGSGTTLKPRRVETSVL